jgi:hypothetical protein
MPHLGRPYPWVRNYDTWTFARGSFFQLAARYKCVATVWPLPILACENSQAITSSEWDADYIGGYVKWVFDFPCTPIGSTFELRLTLPNDMRNQRWVYVCFLGGVETNRTNALPFANPYGLPTVPGNPDWTLNTGLFKHVIFNVGLNPVPWPP